MPENTIPKRRKSVKLTSNERRVLRKAVKNSTQDEVATEIGINRNTLRSACIVGSASYTTVEKIRAWVTPAAVA